MILVLKEVTRKFKRKQMLQGQFFSLGHAFAFCHRVCKTCLVQHFGCTLHKKFYRIEMIPILPRFKILSGDEVVCCPIIR